jgi:hypothetical protein
MPDGATARRAKAMSDGCSWAATSDGRRCGTYLIREKRNREQNNRASAGACAKKRAVHLEASPANASLSMGQLWGCCVMKGGAVF